MTLCRLILAPWALLELPDRQKVIEGLLSFKDILKYNKQGYNAYYLPNSPKHYDSTKTLDGSQIDDFKWVFVDCDLKDKVYNSKDEFLEALGMSGLEPAKIIDSGNGVHAYWLVSDLTAMDYLRFQRRLMRMLNTDPAVGQIFQLMRMPNTLNTKNKTDQPLCIELYSSKATYSCEELDKALPPITIADETHCQQHYEKTYKLRTKKDVSDTLPPKFGALIRGSEEVRRIWKGESDDRSADDFRLGHLLFANEFSKEEATTVLGNTAKARQRGPIHRRSYAENIVDKIWTYELTNNKEDLELSQTIAQVLKKDINSPKGMPFRCDECIDNTDYGFRLGQVIGLAAGSGVGKTAFALNMFRWFAKNNPDYHHFFVPLEQPANEIAHRWDKMSQGDTKMHEKVHIISNYDDAGNFRHLSFDEIKAYLQKFQEKNNIKIGCVVIDHIGALKKEDKNGENQALMDICHSMKAFAIQTNTLLVMQSQSSREKAGIGDLELNKDAAYGTVYFESYCDYLITLWQPLKRCHQDESCPTVTAYKFCKIRHKNAKKDKIKEDVPYFLYFDSETELMKDMTQSQEVSFSYFLPIATNKRKADRKTELVSYQSVLVKQEIKAVISGKTTTNSH